MHRKRVWSADERQKRNIEMKNCHKTVCVFTCLQQIYLEFSRISIDIIVLITIELG